MVQIVALGHGADGCDIVTKGYGGTLTAHSEVGAYTEFIVTLPQDQSVAVAAPELAAAEGE